MMICMAELERRPSQLGDLIRRLRETRHWSQYELAVRAKLSPSTIHKIEVGKTTSPRVDALQSIAAAFSMTLDELAGEGDEATVRLYGDHWLERAMGMFAPTTPAAQAFELLESFDALSGPQREAAILMIEGLRKGARPGHDETKRHRTEGEGDGEVEEEEETEAEERERQLRAKEG